MTNDFLLSNVCFCWSLLCWVNKWAIILVPCSWRWPQTLYTWLPMEIPYYGQFPAVSWNAPLSSQVRSSWVQILTNHVIWCQDLNGMVFKITAHQRCISIKKHKHRGEHWCIYYHNPKPLTQESLSTGWPSRSLRTCLLLPESHWHEGPHVWATPCVLNRWWVIKYGIYYGLQCCKSTHVEGPVLHFMEHLKAYSGGIQ